MGKFPGLAPLCLILLNACASQPAGTVEFPTPDAAGMEACRGLPALTDPTPKGMLRNHIAVAKLYDSCGIKQRTLAQWICEQFELHNRRPLELPVCKPTGESP